MPYVAAQTSPNLPAAIFGSSRRFGVKPDIIGRDGTSPVIIGRRGSFPAIVGGSSHWAGASRFAGGRSNFGSWGYNPGVVWAGRRLRISGVAMPTIPDATKHGIIGFLAGAVAGAVGAFAFRR